MLINCRVAFAQDLMTLMMKNVSLIFQGKYREQLPVLDSILKADSTRRNFHRKPGEAPQLSYNLLETKAVLYGNIGDYAKAELLFNKIINVGVNSGGHANVSLYTKTLGDLAQLYEKMGDDDAAEKVLEELIISKYTHLDTETISANVNSEINKVTGAMRPFKNKPQYVAWAMNLHHITDSTNRAQYKRLSRKVDTGADARAFLYYKQVVNEKFDSVQFIQNLEPDWAADSLEMVKRDSIYQGSTSLKDMVRLQVMDNQQFKRPSATQLDLLKQGKLTFVGERYLLVNDPWGDVQTLFGIYIKKHNYKAAEVLIKQAIGIDDRHPVSQGFYAKNGALFSTLGKALDTIKTYKHSALMLRQSVGMHQIHAGVDVFYIKNKILLAQLYKETGRNRQCQLLSDSIYDLCKLFSADSSVFLMNYLADVYAKIGKYKNAEELYNKLTVYPDDIFGEKSNYGMYYLSSLDELARLYKITADYANTESVLGKALAYDKNARREDYPDHLNRVIQMAQLYETTGRLSLAEQYCSSDMGPVLSSIKKNFSFLSESEKILFINNQISAFDFSASLLITDPSPKPDFIAQTCNQQLQLKGLILKDEEKVFQNIRNSDDQRLKKMFADWENSRSMIAWQYNQPSTTESQHLTDSLNAIANEQEKKINQLSASFNNISQNSQIDFKQVKHALKNGEAAIEFVRFNYYHKKWTDTIKYGAFVILPNDDKPRFIPLCNEGQLTRLFKPTDYSFPINFYENGADEKGPKKSDILYNLVWKPLNASLNGVGKIFIAPAGLLNRVAFNVLPIDSNRFLMDKYEIRQYGSVSEIAEQKPDEKKVYPIDAVLYGGINYDERDTENPGSSVKTAYAFADTAKSNIIYNKLLFLEGTISEVKQIGLLFKQNNKTASIITGTAATGESFKKLSGNSPWVIHLATHAFLDLNTYAGNLNDAPPAFSDNPMLRSGIYMAGANGAYTGLARGEVGQDDGILTAYEISHLDLSNTDLVVLSACQTALGDINGTEGVFGLQRALKLAGVKNMLLSLWEVPDAQTAELMKLFYANKLKGWPNYEALKNAEEAMRSDPDPEFHDPYFWAGFELIE